MVTHSKVVWYDGMFLRPQHFQQQDRYLETLVRDRAVHLQPYDWGILELILDEHALDSGKVAILKCKGILPDGTPFNIPDEDDPPAPLLIDVTLRDSWILLALPDRNQAAEVDLEKPGITLARYRMQTQPLRNNVAGSEHLEESIKIGKQQFKLLIENNKSHGGYSVIRVARLVEKRDQRVILADDFIPPALDCGSWPLLSGFLDEIRSLLKQCGEELASRVPVPLEEGTGNIEDLLMLQVVNVHHSRFTHLCRMRGLHPEKFYDITLQLACELATFTRNPRLAPAFPFYDHDDLHTAIKPVLEELRKSLRRDVKPRVTEIILEKFDDREGRRYLARMSPALHNLLNEASFILMVNLPENLLDTFAHQCIVSAAEESDNLIANIVPGIQLQRLNTVPPNIYDKDFIYFELERGTEFWERVKTSDVGMAFYPAVKYPRMTMRLWAIKEKRR